MKIFGRFQMLISVISDADRSGWVMLSGKGALFSLLRYRVLQGPHRADRTPCARLEKETHDKSGRKGKCAETPENDADTVDIAARADEAPDDAKHCGAAQEPAEPGRQDEGRE